MAWDAPRRHNPLPRSLGRPVFFVDELDFHHKNTLEISEQAQDATSAMLAQLSPTEDQRRFLVVDAPLLVRVTARFHDPAIRFTYDRTYHSSPSFTPTARICRGLLTRIEHCSKELITRKDSDALNASQCLRKGPKPIRFELSFQVGRQGHSGVWAERSFTSYQKHALTSSSAMDVLRSTHSIVGMFLRRHDKGFEWTDEPAHDHFPDKPSTFKPSPRGPLDLACVPRSHFIESHQTWEFVPGYCLELTLTSRNPARHQPDIRRILKVDSEQNTPLNLGLGEDLLWQAHRSVQEALDQKKSSFDLEHAACDAFDGVPDCDCHHFEENALDVGLRIVNNLGPVYDHLHRDIQSSLRLFTHPSGQDCDDFVAKIQTRLRLFRNETDKKVEGLNDFDFRIAELTGHGWQRKNCTRFIIDSSQSHTRRSIQALLDRIRTGVSDVLRGNDVAIRMIAYKRGHLILDKALVARNHKSEPGLDTLDSQQHLILAELERRIQQDIDMVCQDTCDVDDGLELASVSEADFRRPRISSSSSRPFPPRDTSSQRSQQRRPESPEIFTTRPPIPPEIPPRTSSRVFPLVPARDLANKTARKEPALAVEMPSTIVPECDREGHIRIADTQGLKPAAEVYKSSKEDYDMETSSTHSSIPALTESDTPSPDQSMLITPLRVRASSPTPREMPSIEDFSPHCFSSPSMMDTSAPSSTTFSDLDRFEEPKAAPVRRNMQLSGRPSTPKTSGIKDSVPRNTPRTPEDTSGDEKTPLAHRHMQEFAEATELGDAGMPQESFRRNADKGSERSEPGPTSNHVTAETDRLESVPRGLPVQGWLLDSVEEEEAAYDDLLDETHGMAGKLASIAECDSEDTHRPSTLVQYPSIDSLIGLRDETLKKGYSSVLASYRKATFYHAQISVPTEQSELTPATVFASAPGQLTMHDELPRSNLDLSQQEKDSATTLEVVKSSEVDDQQMGKSERSGTGHVIPFSDSGIETRAGSETTDRSGSEFDEKHALPPIDESAFEVGTANSMLSSQTSPTDRERDTTSGPLGDANVSVTTDSSMETGEGPESLFEVPDAAKETLIPAPKPTFASAKLPRVRTSGPGSRSISNPQPSPTHLGLGNAHLLPSPPIFSACRSASHGTRASWSTCTSWEDYISTARQSSDSVNTIQPSPTSSEDADPLDSPKRLGTPTAGFLGLNESRWAEFGIRTALTGTHAFDCLSTAPVPESPESSHRVAQPSSELQHSNEKTAGESPSPPRKSVLLRHKKSIGSIVVASKLKRKESKELRMQKSIEMKSLKKSKSKGQGLLSSREGEDDAARFPKAMMLVAGLAFASSIVSRGHS